MKGKKVALITGGASGIGLATVNKFLDSDFYVIVVDNDSAALQKLPDSTIKKYLCDVTKESDVKKLVESINDEVGYIDVLVSNAGRALVEEFEFEMPDYNTWLDSIRLNLSSHYLVTYHLSELLKASTLKSIVLMSSINSVSGFGLVAYSSAKAGLLGLTVSSAKHLGAHGIRINAVLPGTVEPSNQDKLENKDYTEMSRNSILKKCASENDIASVIYSVACEFQHMTGQKVIIDGGQTIFNN